MACVKALLFALILPCAGPSHDAAQSVAKPCPKQAARDDMRTPRWEPGRGFLYARY